MKFMLIMQGTRAGWEAMSRFTPAEAEANAKYMLGLRDELLRSGELAEAQGLDGPEKARVVTGRPAGPPLVSDGPFPESKEFLAGFWIVEVATPERALEIAARASLAPGQGGAPLAFPIEVREVVCAPVDPRGG